MIHCAPLIEPNGIVIKSSYHHAQPSARHPLHSTTQIVKPLASRSM